MARRTLAGSGASPRQSSEQAGRLVKGERVVWTDQRLAALRITRRSPSGPATLSGQSFGGKAPSAVAFVNGCAIEVIARRRMSVKESARGETGSQGASSPVCGGTPTEVRGGSFLRFAEPDSGALRMLRPSVRAAGHPCLQQSRVEAHHHEEGPQVEKRILVERHGRLGLWRAPEPRREPDEGASKGQCQP